MGDLLKSQVVVDVTKVPEALAMMRRELAALLRLHARMLDATGEQPTTDDLREIAAMFESGAGLDD